MTWCLDSRFKIANERLIAAFAHGGHSICRVTPCITCITDTLRVADGFAEDGEIDQNIMIDIFWLMIIDYCTEMNLESRTE